MIQRPALTRDDAMTLLLAAEAEAARNDWAVSLAVCDDGGHLMAFVRRPGATPASASICWSSPLANISLTMSQPPTNSPLM